MKSLKLIQSEIQATESKLRRERASHAAFRGNLDVSFYAKRQIQLLEHKLTFLKVQEKRALNGTK